MKIMPMPSLFYLLATSALFVSLNAAPPKTSSWSLTFDDEFDGASLDTTKWHPHDHFCGVRGTEMEAYMPENISVANGLCREKCEKRTVNYGYCGLPAIVKNYASGMMVTMDKFDQQYGYFECRCKVPNGKGYWPAFWLMPYNKWPPEIDILEILCDDAHKVYMTNHWSVNGQHLSNGGSYTGPDFSADFHTFGVEWDTSKIVWYVDSIERFRSTSGIPAEPFFILANLALGGDWPGPPDSTTVLPGYFDIDWVRVYKKAGPQNAVMQCSAVLSQKGFTVSQCEKGIVIHSNGGSGNIRVMTIDGKVVEDIFIKENSREIFRPKRRGVYLLEGKGRLTGMMGKFVY